MELIPLAKKQTQDGEEQEELSSGDSLKLDLYFWLQALVLALVLGPLSAPTLENLFWFFTYHLTVTPVLILLPIFLLLGGLVPLAVYRSVARVSVVERLREAEG